MHNVFACTSESLQFANMRPPSRFFNLKNWSNKVNGTHSSFLKYDYSHVKSCNHENDYNHKNGIVAMLILLHG